MKILVVVTCAVVVLAGCGGSAAEPTPAPTIDISETDAAVEEQVTRFFGGMSTEEIQDAIKSHNFSDEFMPHGLTVRSMSPGTASSGASFVDANINSSSIGSSEEVTNSGITFMDGSSWDVKLRFLVYGSPQLANQAFNDFTADNAVYRYDAFASGPFEGATRYAPATASMGRQESESEAFLTVGRIVINAYALFSSSELADPNLSPYGLVEDVAIAAAMHIEQASQQSGTPVSDMAFGYIMMVPRPIRSRRTHESSTTCRERSHSGRFWLAPLPPLQHPNEYMSTRIAYSVQS
ncbi:MAG: hypothetical protein M3457_14580 [Chloroflexota bacterium]|nr:hypothetical protein [Chloroflexota bacterium]